MVADLRMVRFHHDFEIVDVQGAEGRPVAEMRWLQHPPLHDPPGFSRRPVCIEPPECLGGADAKGGHDEQGITRGRRGEREHTLPSAPRERIGVLGREKWDIGSNACREAEEDVEVHGLIVHRGEGTQHRARIRTATAKTSSNRNALRQFDRKSAAHPAGREIRLRRAPGEVLRDGAEQRGIDVARYVQRACVRCTADAYGVGEINPEKECLQLVIAVRLPRENAKPQVDLCLRRDLL